MTVLKKDSLLIPVSKSQWGDQSRLLCCLFILTTFGDPGVFHFISPPSATGLSPTQMNLITFVLVFYCYYTNYHKHSDLKHHELIILQFCRLEVKHEFQCDKNQCVSRVVFFSGGWGENPFAYIFQFLWAHCGPWLIASFLHQLNK